MKKKLGIVLIILGILISILLIDTSQAKIFNNSPVIKLTEDYNGGNLYKKNKGILVDNYVYTNGDKKTIFKWEKYTTPINDSIEKEGNKNKFKTRKATTTTERVGGLIPYGMTSDLINEIPEDYFLNLDSDMTYDELVSEIGYPNGTVGSGIVRWYWRIGEDKYAVCDIRMEHLHFEIWRGNQ